MKKRDGDVTVAAVLTHHALAAILFDRAAVRILRPSTASLTHSASQQPRWPPTDRAAVENADISGINHTPSTISARNDLKSI
ncbi:MAG TPA: hypothetical protein VER26_04405 [Xanthobacteraceae bacterium]|nr:hypothetical protein [Xanthobacteraceae bacterium]